MYIFKRWPMVRLPASTCLYFYSLRLRLSLSELEHPIACLESRITADGRGQPSLRSINYDCLSCPQRSSPLPLLLSPRPSYLPPAFIQLLPNARRGNSSSIITLLLSRASFIFVPFYYFGASLSYSFNVLFMRFWSAFNILSIFFWPRLI